MNFVSFIIFVAIATGVFWLVLQHFMFNFTAKLGSYAGVTILDVTGNPTPAGIIVHGIVLGLILGGVAAALPC